MNDGKALAAKGESTMTDTGNKTETAKGESTMTDAGNKTETAKGESTMTDAERRLLRAIFGEEDGREYCVFLAPDENDRGSVPMWFSEWIKYRDDLPAGMKEWLDTAHVRPGESAPIFTDASGHLECMRFAYKDMAEHVAERIAGMYPEFKDRLVVMECEDAPDEEDEEEPIPQI